jgi:predicted PurR-regulated permease PerM
MVTNSGSIRSKDNEGPYYIKLAAVLVSIIAIVYIMYTLSETLIPLAFSVLFAILLHPVCVVLERWRVPRIVAIVLSIVLLVAVIAGLVYIASIQIAGFAAEIPRITERSEKLLEELLTMGERYLNISRSEQLGEAKKYLLRILSESREILLGTIVATTTTLTTAALVPLYIFFFLLYRDFFRRFVHKAFKSWPKQVLNTVLQKIYVVIQSYLAGLLLVIIIVGILNSIGLLLLGIDYAIFFGFLAAFLILIPYIGILIGSILPAFLSLVTEDSPWYAVGVIGILGFVQFLEGNFITPNVVGSKVSVNPLAAIVALLLGGQLWGLSGLILALPFTAILKVILDSNKNLEPFGYLLGEPEQEVAEEIAMEQQAAIKKRRRNQNSRRRKPKPVQQVTGDSSQSA